MYLFGAIYEFDEETHTSKITLEEVAYWRKQNAIHNWMVENVQRGVDNCASYDFDKSCLKSLLAKCKEVLKNPTAKNAMEILPTKEGFFFGGTEDPDSTGCSFNTSSLILLECVLLFVSFTITICSIPTTCVGTLHVL